MTEKKHDMDIFERYLTVWIGLCIILAITYYAAKKIGVSYEDAALIGASNHFEVAIAIAVMLFGLSSGAALATVVGVLIEVPLMLMLALVKYCKRIRGWFS